FSFTASKAPATFQCRVETTGAWTACTSPTTLAALADGAHNFSVRAIDGAGNTDATPASYTWIVDTVAPDTTITSNPPAVSSSTSATFAFSSTKPGSTFECALDGGGYASCTSPDTLTGLVDGPHTFAVRAINAAGNVDATPASYTWTVSTAAPDTTITSQPPTP